MCNLWSSSADREEIYRRFTISLVSPLYLSPIRIDILQYLLFGILKLHTSARKWGAQATLYMLFVVRSNSYEKLNI